MQSSVLACRILPGWMQIKKTPLGPQRAGGLFWVTQQRTPNTSPNAQYPVSGTGVSRLAPVKLFLSKTGRWWGGGGALHKCRAPGAADSREGSLEKVGPHQPG